MNPTFELYVDRRSWLHSLDPRTKLLFVALGTISLLTFSSLPIVVAFLLAAHLIILSAHIPWSRIRWIWGRMLPITVLIPLLWPLFYQRGGRVLLHLWRIKVTSYGLVEGIAMALRVDALAFVGFILLLSTGQAELVQGLVRLGMPFDWGLTLAIALRYLPTLYGIYVMISEAQQARGWAIGRGNFVQRARSYLPVLVAMIISVLRMTDNLAMALAARGFGARPKRTYFREVKFSSADAICLSLLTTLFIVLMVARFGYGIGTHP